MIDQLPMLAEVAEASASTIHYGLAAIGAGIGIGLIGYGAAEATGRNPSASGAVLVSSIILGALIEGVALITIFVK